MNALNMARMAYSSPTTPIRTPQGIEYDAFARVTTRLKTLSTSQKKDFPALASALNDNRRLWLILATDVAQAGNKLPDMLRAQILYLSEFTARHSSDVLGGAATVDALIDVNTSVMRGLRLQEARQ